MVSVQYFDRNAPQSVKSSALSEASIVGIDGIDLVEQFFEFEMDSDVESILTDSTYSDDSSYCSVNFDSDCDSHVDCTRQLPKMPLTTTSRQKPIVVWPLYDESARRNATRPRNDAADELSSVISCDSLNDAKKRGLVRRSIDSRLKCRNLPKQSKRNKISAFTTKQAERDFDFESDEETVYNVALK